MPSWKKVITSGSDASLNSLYAPSITGSLLGTASYATTASYALNALTASFAATASSALNAQDVLIYVKNVTGAQIDKGSVVRISGATGDNALISTASYDSDGLSANTLGITNQDIPHDSFGYVMTEGRLLGINTNAFSAGQLLYLGATGSIIGTAPVAPLHSVRLGQVLRVQTNNGSMYVRIDNGYELGELHDIADTTTTASYGDLLVKSGSVWINSKQLTGSYAITGSLNATSFTGSLFGTSSWASNAVSASFATSASWAPGGGASFPYTGSAEITGSLGVTGSFSVLDSIDATNKILIGSGLIPGSTANSVDWSSRTLFDTNGNFSIRWGNLRTMYDANVSASIDWNNRQLKDANGINIVNWQSGISITGSNITTGSVEVTGSFKVQDSIDSSNKWLIGPGGIPGSTATAVAWSDRQLLNSSGATIVNWETGVFTGTATSASFAATASFINPLNQSMVITGSLRGQVSALSILSNTASVDMVTNNFFTLTLPNGASTNINPTNINPGQTVNILVTQGSAGTGTVTFPSLVKQASGSLYTGSAVANAIDIVTMIAFDATNVYVSSIRNMI